MHHRTEIYNRENIAASKGVTTTLHQVKNPNLEDSRFRHNHYALKVFVIDNNRAYLP